MSISITKQEFEMYLKLNDIKYIRLAFLDLLSQMRFITLPVKRKDEIYNNEISFDGSSITCLKKDTDSDLYLHPDFSSMCILKYLDQQEPTLNIFCDLYETTSIPYKNDSRYILKKRLSDLMVQGLYFNLGIEIEFYLLDENNQFVDKSSYFEIGDEKCEKCIHEIISTLEKMGIDVRAFHHEVGPSQYEISYNYAEPIKTIENMVIIKDAIDKIAKRHHLSASFIPKIKNGLAGNGLHMNLSLKDEYNNNLFADDNFISEYAQYFINGILSHATEINVFANTTNNSYLRLSDGIEAPRYISYGLYNRSAMIRIPKSSISKKRIEIRNPDHYLSPYIYVYLLIQSGLDGVNKKVNKYQPLDSKKEKDFSNLSLLPLNLLNAKQATKNSQFIKENLSSVFLDLYFSAHEKSTL